jgi:16S rRNA U516 pseudouridylate synthase RsuA-like enzyme
VKKSKSKMKNGSTCKNSGSCVSFWLEEKLKRKLKQLAERDGFSVSEVLRTQVLKIV